LTDDGEKALLRRETEVTVEKTKRNYQSVGFLLRGNLDQENTLKKKESKISRESANCKGGDAQKDISRAMFFWGRQG